MAYTVEQIATALEAKAFGAVDRLITGATEPALAGPDDLALAMADKFAKQLGDSAARVAMLRDGAEWQTLGLKAAIVPQRPRFAMAGLTQMLDTRADFGTGVHPSAVIDPSANVPSDAAIGPLSVVGPDVQLGQGAMIGAHVSIAAGAIIGTNAQIRDGVRIGADARIGDRFVAQPGAVVGGDGFSFVTPEESNIEKVRGSLGDQGDIKNQSYARIHSLGSVRIGDDVELGANVCVDRGTVRDTEIGNGVKIDNLAQIGHNVQIGNDCLICAQVGIAGSSRIGNNVVLGGQTGVSDNVFIGDNAITGGATKVLANVPAGRVMLGYPAMKMDSHIGTYKLIRRLPRLFRDVRLLQKTVLKTDKID